MNVFFRVDASIAIGTGHVVRCKTLANALRQRGAEVHFIIRALQGHMGDLLAQDNFAVTFLSDEPPLIKSFSYGYSGCLGVDQTKDAAQCISILKKTKCDWLIVDHYDLDRKWEEFLRPYAQKLMVIEDLPNRPHYCDLLVDQNYSSGDEQRYQGWVSSYCQMLLGPRYALLNPVYAKYRDTLQPRSGEVKQVLVYMGGSDNANVTGMVLSALSASALAHLDVVVVIGVNNIHKNLVTQQSIERPNTHVCSSRSDLAELMIKADIAIGAGGVTTWERMCMGLPSVVISIAKNQIPACEALEHDGLIHYLGEARNLTVANLLTEFVTFIFDHEKLRSISAKTQMYVDGKGVDRLIEALIQTKITNLKLRNATKSDALIYFNWANDPVVRENAVEMSPIHMCSHLRWFDNRLNSPNSFLFILEAENLPVGQIRFDKENEEAEIDYSLDSLVRGRKWAKQLLKLGIDAMNNIQPIQLKATVKPQNFASVATFIKLGFTEHSNDGGMRHFTLSPQVPKNSSNK